MAVTQLMQRILVPYRRIPESGPKTASNANVALDLNRLPSSLNGGIWNMRTPFSLACIVLLASVFGGRAQASPPRAGTYIGFGDLQLILHVTPTGAFTGKGVYETKTTVQGPYSDYKTQASVFRGQFDAAGHAVVLTSRDPSISWYLALQFRKEPELAIEASAYYSKHGNLHGYARMIAYPLAASPELAGSYTAVLAT